MDRHQDRALIMPVPFVEITAIGRRFDDAVALRDVSLSLARGEILGLLGPSGCGKSTLLRIIAGLEAPDGGDIRIGGRSVVGLPPYRRPVNMMFQSYALFPHMSVEENIAFGLRQAGIGRDERAGRVDRLLELVRMTPYRRRRPGQLSGGQQQRVALARSLAREPELLLLDEPMGALDRKLRADMQFELAEILRRVQVTCILVTHDPEEAMAMADRIVLMESGEVIQQGTPAEVYSRPRTRFAAEFLGAVNFLTGHVAALAAGRVRIEIPALADGLELPLPEDAELRPGQEVTVALRPEQLRLVPADDPEGRPVTVEDRAFLGTHTSFRVRLNGHVLAVNQPGGPGDGPGFSSTARLRWDAHAPRLLVA